MINTVDLNANLWHFILQSSSPMLFIGNMLHYPLLPCLLQLLARQQGSLVLLMEECKNQFTYTYMYMVGWNYTHQLKFGMVHPSTLIWFTSQYKTLKYCYKNSASLKNKQVYHLLSMSTCWSCSVFALQRAALQRHRALYKHTPSSKQVSRGQGWDVAEESAGELQSSTQRDPQPDAGLGRCRHPRAMLPGSRSTADPLGLLSTSPFLAVWPQTIAMFYTKKHLRGELQHRH